MTGIKLKVDKDAARVKELRSGYAEFNRMYGFQKIDPRYIYFAAAMVSLLWAAVIWYYAANSIYSLSSLLKMLPHEFGGFLAGTIMPIGFIWMIALYIDRNMNSNYEKEVIYPFLQSIIDPHGDTSVITNVIREKVAAETAALGDALDALSGASDKLGSLASNVASSTARALGDMRDEEAALKSISSELSRSAEDIGAKSAGTLKAISEHVGLLLETADAIGRRTSAVVDDIESASTKAASVKKTVGEISRDIGDSVSAALAKAEGIGGSLKDMESSLVSSAEVMEARASQLLSRIEDSSGAFVIKANISAEKIAGATGAMDGSIEEINRLSNENKKVVLASLDQVGKSLGFISQRLDDHERAFGDKSSAALSGVEAFGRKFEELGARIGAIALGVVEKFQGASREMDGFASSAKGIGELAEKATGNIRESSAEMVAASGNVRSAIGEIGALMESSGKNLGEQAANALKFASEIKATLKRQIDDLEDAANNVSTQARIGEMSIEKQGEKLAALSEGLLVKADAMNGKISTTINNIMVLSERLDDKLRSMGESILAKAASASKMMQDGVEGAGARADSFRGIAADLAESSRAAAAGLDALTRAARAVPELSGSVSAAGKELSAAASALEGTALKSGELISNLKDVGAQFSKFAASKSSEFELIAASQAKAMAGVAQYANKLSADAKSALEELARGQGGIASRPAPGVSIARAEEFLGRAGYIIEKLGSVAIDLSRILSPDIGQELWNKYNAGHRSAFARYLSDSLGKRSASALQNLARTNPEFRAAAKSYVDEFDSLVLRARGADKGEILLATITSSDIGKAYMILKEIL